MARFALLTEQPNVIAERRTRRDGIGHNIAAIDRSQDEEYSYAALIADMRSIPFTVSPGSDDLSNPLEFVREIIWRDSDGRQNSPQEVLRHRPGRFVFRFPQSRLSR
jgi:hypothetical protein